MNNLEDKKTKIFEAARELFLENGFKKTNVAGIAKRANIAVGSFYRFYDSKEDIFVQIYNHENEQIKREILAEVDFDQEPHQLFHQVLQSIFEHSTDNKILQVWFDESKINDLIVQTVDIDQSFAYVTFSKLVDQWIVQDKVKTNLTKQRIMELFNVLTIVDIHQNEITTDDYFQTLNDLVDSILLFILK